MVLKKEMDSLNQMISHADKIKKSVSIAGIDWHIDHSLRVISGVCSALQKSDPKDYRWKFNLTKLYIFTRKSIPRGKAKAPKQVVSTEKIEIKNLMEQYRDALKLLISIENISKNSHFKHPYFGVLNLKETERFLIIHTQHHLKIMQDIIAKNL